MLLSVSLPPPAAADAIRAAWDRGQPVAPLNPAATPDETARASAALQPDEPVDPDVAAVVMTSGTTGDPRGVELTWAGLQAMASAVHRARPGDHWLGCLPLHHVAGLAVLARAWATGTGLTVLERFDVEAVAAVGKANHVSLVPTMVRRLLAAGVDLSRFEQIMVGGGPVPDDIRRLPNAVATYGLTETWGGVVHDGYPLSGVEVTLASDGEILLHTPTVMRGYRLDAAATAAAFTPDGRLRTGDVGTFAPDGRLVVVDRQHDMVITGGVNVSPGEVERALASHPAIADVCVAGAPDDEWGERVVAFVVPLDPGDPPGLEQLRDYARRHLSPPKLPREVVIVDSIPRTPAGKPLRRALRSSHLASPTMADENEKTRNFGMRQGAQRDQGHDEDEEDQEDHEPEILPDDATVDVEAEKKETNTDEVLERLDRELVGLVPVKTRIGEIADLLVVDRLRRRFGIESSRPTLHMSFTGSPGTGKTTVAMRMAELLHGLGYLAKGHLVNVTRDDLVGQYIGHTAPKTREVLKRAMGGVLFIDEAYYLYRQENERDYGQETIEILLQIMENEREDMVVILAGYKDKMDVFFSSNPGMGSRIAHHIDFPDYSLDELMQIAKLMLDQQQYQLSDEADAAFRDYLERRMRQPRFANARSVRNALERARLRQASRIVKATNRTLSKADLLRIEADDILKSRVFDDEGGGTAADSAANEADESEGGDTGDSDGSSDDKSDSDSDG